MGFVKWLIAGAVGGAVGAAIWAAIVYYAHAEVGWIAWGIGFLVGMCVRFAAGEEDGFGPGITAVSSAGLSIVVGKFAAAWLLVAGIVGGGGSQITANDLTVDFATEIAKEREAQGQKIVWPPSVTADSADKQQDYPADIWQAASKKWTDLPPAEQSQKLATRQKEVDQFRKMMEGVLRQQVFANSFSPYDILWFVLAAMTAYKIGSGASSNE